MATSILYYASYAKDLLLDQNETFDFLGLYSGFYFIDFVIRAPKWGNKLDKICLDGIAISIPNMWIAFDFHIYYIWFYPVNGGMLGVSTFE